MSMLIGLTGCVVVMKPSALNSVLKFALTFTLMLQVLWLNRNDEWVSLMTTQLSGVQCYHFSSMTSNISSITFLPIYSEYWFLTHQIFLNPIFFLPAQLLHPFPLPKGFHSLCWSSHVIVKGVKSPTRISYCLFQSPWCKFFQIIPDIPRVDVYSRATQLGFPYSQESEVITFRRNLSYSILRWIVIYKWLFLIRDHKGNKQGIDRL